MVEGTPEGSLILEVRAGFNRLEKGRGEEPVAWCVAFWAWRREEDTNPNPARFPYQQFLFQNGEMVPEIAQARLFAAFANGP